MNKEIEIDNELIKQKKYAQSITIEQIDSRHTKSASTSMMMS